MICAIGLGILGFLAFRRARRFGCHHGGHGRGRRGGGRFDRRRWMFRRVLERIDATPAQERLIVGELDKLQDRLRDARHDLRATRGDLAQAIRQPTLDDAALGAALGRVDTATADARGALVASLRTIHAALDDKQRAELAELLDCTGGGWWRNGPYR